MLKYINSLKCLRAHQFRCRPASGLRASLHPFQPSSSFSSTSMKMASGTFPDQSYKSALVALNTLQSNAQTIAAWIEQRRTNPNADLKDEMMHGVKSIGVDLEKLSVIHVAGTKGKGSVCAFTESILRQSGYKTGLYTSPHLVSLRERFRINGQSISPELFSRHFWTVWNKLEAAKNKEYPNMPSYFRFLTLLSFHIFLEERVDVAILEVGVGGRSDATNIFDHPVACGIASIGYDHMNVLGNTLTEIAFEKASICKPGRPAFTISQVEEAMNSLQNTSIKIRGEPLTVVTPSTFGIENLKLGLEGEHHFHNAALAIALSKTWLKDAKGVDIPWVQVPPSFVVALQNCFWPGRSHKIAVTPNITIFLDGAHTVESMDACNKWWQSQDHSNAVRVLLFNCHTSRSPAKLLAVWAHQADTFAAVIFSTNESERERILEDKREEKPEGTKWQEKVRDTWQSLLAQNADEQTCQELAKRVVISSSIPHVLSILSNLERQHPGKRIHVLATGSLYLVGACLEVLTPEMCDVLPPPRSAVLLSSALTSLGVALLTLSFLSLLWTKFSTSKKQ